MAGFCVTCGQPLKVGAKFCGKCGQAVETDVAAPRSTAAYPNPPTVTPSFGWNWGAFLLPGIWAIAHRARASVAGVIVLGLAYVGALIALVVNLVGWQSDPVNPFGGDSGFVKLQFLEHATVSAAWLLGIYIASCLFSLRNAREGSEVAFENAGGGDAAGFQAGQQGWGVAGAVVALAHVALVVFLASVYFPAHKKVNTLPGQGIPPMNPAAMGARGGGSQ
jgi:hypothetical protein